nr:TIGR03943 family protein [Phytoactinopolyspora alkaliphila]
MDERTQAVLLLALAAISIRLGLSSAALAYIKPGLQPALLVAGIALALLGGHGLLRSLRSGPSPGGDGADHDHRHAPGVAWLLMVPLLALLLIAPPALGSFAVDRQGSAPPASAGVGFLELPAPREGAVDLALREYVSRALYDPGRSLDGVPVRLVGFATPDDDGGYRLSRFTVNCCAADATAFSVEVVGDAARPPDTWLEVTGRWEQRPGHEPGTLSDEPPVIVAEQVSVIPAPDEPYEY